MNLKETHFIFPSYISLGLPNPSLAGACSKSEFLNEVVGINSIYSFKHFSSKLKAIFLKKNDTQSKTESAKIMKKNLHKKNETKMNDDQSNHDNEEAKEDKTNEHQENIAKIKELVNKDEIILVLKGLIHEKIVGVADEIKGSIKGIFQSLGEKNEEIKKEMILFYQNYVSEFLVNELANRNLGLPFDFEKEKKTILSFTNIIGLYECFHCYFDRKIIRNWLLLQNTFLRSLQQILEDRKLYLLKHLSLLGETLRNLYDFYHYLNLLENEDILCEIGVVEDNMKILERFYEFSNIISKDVISQVSIITFYKIIKITKEYTPEYFETMLSFLKSFENENDTIQALSKIRSLSLLEKNLNFYEIKIMNKSENLLSFVLNVCTNSTQYTKLYAFKTLQEILINIQENQIIIDKINEDKTISDWIFEVFVKNWEFPLRGLSNILENTLKIYLSFFQDLDMITKFVRMTLNISSSTNKRKYYILNIISEFLPPDWLIKNYDNLITELLLFSGDQFNVSSVFLLESLLDRLYVFVDKNINIWSNFWINEYFKILESEKYSNVKGIILNVHPILTKINKDVIFLLIQKICQEDKLENKNFLWSFVSLFKLAREKALIVSEPEGYRINNITINKKFIETLLFNSDRYITLEVLQFLTYAKKTTEMPSQIEYDLILSCLDKNIKTSYPDFRVPLIVIYKRFLFRLRTVYESELEYTGEINMKKEKGKKVKNIDSLKKFILGVFAIINPTLFPDCPFEVISPHLDLMKIIFQVLGPNYYLYRKNIDYKGVTLLVDLNIFSYNLYEYLLLNLQASYESVRKQAFEILLLFPQQLEFLTEAKLSEYFLNGIQCSKSLVIKVYESSAYLISLFYNKNLEALSNICLNKENSLNRNDKKLTILSFLINLLENFFNNFEGSFLSNMTIFHDNSCHGLLTVLSYILDNIFGGEEDDFKELIEDKNMQGLYKSEIVKLMLILGRILVFSTKVLGDNVSTSIFDNKELKDSLISEKKYKLDCRGHFVVEPSVSFKDQFIKNFDQLSSGNALLDSATDDLDQENSLVISFYLLTREAGLLFQGMSKIIRFCERKSIECLIPQKNLEDITYKCFDSLLCVKHLGSIERISDGIRDLCATIYASKRPVVLNLAENLLEKVLSSLENGYFTNSLRRSAGLPPSIVCLLNSEVAGRRTKLLPNAIGRLMKLSEQSKTEGVDVRIHGLNILKLIFEDATLKKDVEKFIGNGFQIAIKGFGANDWGVRNSSLMLFSSLSKRTFGSNKSSDQNSMKNCLNILEFFTRAPQLLEFFLKEITDFLNSKNYQNIMYPPIYPIALTFSRLLPYDFKNNYSTTAPAESPENDTLPDPPEEQEFGERRYFDVKDIDRFLPLLIKCGNNKNYMGRVMISRAIQPFISFDRFSNQILSLLDHENLSTLKNVRRNHNFAHGLMLQIRFILNNFLKLRKEIKFKENVFRDFFEDFIHQLSLKLFFLHQVDCPLVNQIYLKIVRMLFKATQEEKLAYEQFYGEVNAYAASQLEKSFSLKHLRYDPDMGHSILRKSLIKFSIEYESKSIIKLTQFFEKFYEQENSFCTADNEVFEIFLKSICNAIKFGDRIPNENLHQLKDLTLKFLSNPTSHTDYFNNSNALMMKLLSYIYSNQHLSMLTKTNETKELFLILLSLESRFTQNSPLMKKLIKLLGILLSQAFQNLTPYLHTFAALIEKYSAPSEKDFLRIAVIKSLKYSFASVFEFLNFENVSTPTKATPTDLHKNSDSKENSTDTTCTISNKNSDPNENVISYKNSEETNENMKDATNKMVKSSKIDEDLSKIREGWSGREKLSLLLQLNKSFIILLQDEIPEIRQKVGKLLSYGRKNEFGFRNLFNPNYVLDGVFEKIAKLKIEEGKMNKASFFEIFTFLMSYMVESEFFSFKERNRRERRIFAYDKPNKFYDEFHLKELSLKALKILKERRKEFSIEKTEIENYLKEFSKERKCQFLNFDLSLIDEFGVNYLNRDDYIFEMIANLLFYLNILKSFEIDWKEYELYVQKINLYEQKLPALIRALLKELNLNR